MIYKELFKDFISQNKLILVLFIIITFLTFPVESIIIPQLYGTLYSSISENKTPKKLKQIGKIILLIIGVWLVIQAFYYVKNIMIGKILPKYLVYTRKKMFMKVLENHETDYKDIKITKNISRIFDLSNDIKDFVYYVMSYLLPLLFTVLLVIVYLFALIVFFVVCFIYSKKIINISAETQRIYLEMTNVFHDSFENLMNIYLNNEKKKEESKIQKYLDEYLLVYNKQMNLISLMTIITSVMSLIIFTIIIGMAYFNYKNGVFNGKKFITVSLIIIYFMSFLINIGTWTSPELLRLGILKNSIPFLKSIFNKKQKNYMKNPDLNGNIVFDKIYYKYSSSNDSINKNIFNNFSFVIEKGKKIAILGSSGSGKTTLIKLLLRLHPIQKGNIFINGINIEKINPEDLRNNINYVNQRTGLFEGTVIDNMKYGNKIDNKKIIELLNKYELSKNFKALKKGIYSDVGVSGKEVSLGMQKIVMNIRGILKKGSIIIFDEPLAGLDAKSRVNMINLINDTCKEKTLIVITHDKEILHIMDKIIDLNKIQDSGGNLGSPQAPS